MKKTKLLIIVLFYFLVSCEDGTVSKKDLLTNTWILEETTLNGESFLHESIYSTNSVYTFFEDETLQIVITQDQNIINGTWQLKDNNTKITIALSGIMYEYTIEKIDNSYLWLSLSDEDGLHQYKYMKMLME
ncbi:MAG: hypothetical protein KAR57_01145 [Bacteroidales bacterium]|nr:hypothetical protein [Bacteroidales bacterium]